jgi:2-dehydropantoate 2-reductase
MTKTKIIVAGIGGVGGYFGGLLAKHFYGHPQVEVSFVARGAHLKQIQLSGLKVIKGPAGFIAKPALATDTPAEIGVADLVIIATKTYDLEAVMRQLQPCMDQSTVILPLLNGVDSRKKIKSMLPDSLVLDGCVYLVSRLKQAGIVENTGNIETLYFGPGNLAHNKLVLFESLFKEAGIEATLSTNIATVIWEKFIFISPTATATSFFNKCIGQVLADSESLDMIKALIDEVKQVAKASGITVSDDITEKTLAKLESLPFETTSSMHSDFKNNKPDTELQSLTAFVINEGQKYSLPTPMYSTMYEVLKRNSKAQNNPVTQHP